MNAKQTFAGCLIAVVTAVSSRTICNACASQRIEVAGRCTLLAAVSQLTQQAVDSASQATTIWHINVLTGRTVTQTLIGNAAVEVASNTTLATCGIGAGKARSNTSHTLANSLIGIVT